MSGTVVYGNKTLDIFGIIRDGPAAAADKHRCQCRLCYGYGRWDLEADCLTIGIDLQCGLLAWGRGGGADHWLYIRDGVCIYQTWSHELVNIWSWWRDDINRWMIDYDEETRYWFTDLVEVFHLSAFIMWCVRMTSYWMAKQHGVILAAFILQLRFTAVISVWFAFAGF